MAEVHDVIAAFADGERVNPEALNDALADAGGREYLIELLVLRDLVHTADPVIDVVPARRRGAGGWLTIAAAVVVSVLGGYTVGRSGVVTELPQVSAPPVVETALPRAPRSAPPATRVIHLQPGVDWKETVGG